MAIPIAKPLRRGGFLAGSGGEKAWATFKYERLPMFCHYCGLLRHDLRHCASYFTRTKNGKEVSFQCGEWLKASEGRMGSGPVKNYWHDTVVDDGRVKLNGERATAAESYNHANPKEQEGNGNGQNSKSGKVKEDGVNNARISTHVEMNMDGLASGCKCNSSLEGSLILNMNKEDPTLHGKRHVIHGGLEHVEDGVSDGPK